MKTPGMQIISFVFTDFFFSIKVENKDLKEIDYCQKYHQNKRGISSIELCVCVCVRG